MHWNRNWRRTPFRFRCGRGRSNRSDGGRIDPRDLREARTSRAYHALNPAASAPVSRSMARCPSCWSSDQYSATTPANWNRMRQQRKDRSCRRQARQATAPSSRSRREEVAHAADRLEHGSAGCPSSFLRSRETAVSTALLDSSSPVSHNAYSSFRFGTRSGVAHQDLQHRALGEGPVRGPRTRSRRRPRHIQLRKPRSGSASP